MNGGAACLLWDVDQRIVDSAHLCILPVQPRSVYSVTAYRLLSGRVSTVAQPVICREEIVDSVIACHLLSRGMGTVAQLRLLPFVGKSVSSGTACRLSSGWV